MILPPLPLPLRHRLQFLLAGNAALLAGIWWLLKEGSSFSDVLRRAGPDVAPIALAGLGLTGIIFTGAIDLSIASIIALSGTVFGLLVFHGFPPVICWCGCIVTAWVCSMANGWLVRGLKVPAIIVTLAGLPLYRGLALIVADWAIPNFGGNISVQDNSFHVPGKNYPGTILWLAVGSVLIWGNFAKRPRQWLALGNSEEACRLLGLSPGKIRQSAFFAGGIFLSLAALIFVTRIQAVEPARMALGFELQVIGAVILGGANIFGGEGSYAGTVLGAFFLYFISQLLVYAGASPYIQDAIAGAIILGVIGVDCALHRRRKLLEEIA